MSTLRLIKSTAFFLAAFIIGFILHTSIFGRLPIGVVTPNVLLLITASFGFMEGGLWGMSYGFVAGLALDSYSMDYFGLNCLILLLVGYVNGMFTRFFYGDDIRLPLLFIGFSDVFYGVFNFIFLAITGHRRDFGFYFMNIIMPEAVYTAIVFVPLYFVIIRGFKWIKKESQRPIV